LGLLEERRGYHGGELSAISDRLSANENVAPNCGGRAAVCAYAARRREYLASVSPGHLHRAGGEGNPAGEDGPNDRRFADAGTALQGDAARRVDGDGASDGGRFSVAGAGADRDQRALLSTVPVIERGSDAGGIRGIGRVCLLGVREAGAILRDRARLARAEHRRGKFRDDRAPPSR